MFCLSVYNLTVIFNLPNFLQVIPLHLPPGDAPMERTVQIDGTSEQIEIAKQMVNEVIEVWMIMLCLVKHVPFSLYIVFQGGYPNIITIYNMFFSAICCFMEFVLFHFPSCD